MEVVSRNLRGERLRKPMKTVRIAGVVVFQTEYQQSLQTNLSLEI
jgi:hypothetical protein